jgi:hypothetical protein
MSAPQQPQTYREVIDDLVRVCREEQGRISADRIRAGVWNQNASEHVPPEQHQLNLLLQRLSQSDRNILADVLAQEVVTGVFETLKVLEKHRIEPFTDGYEGSPYHDFVGRLNGWSWPNE